MTYVLGINAYHADASAVLLRDGRLVAALEEERFRRIKHVAGFPTESIRRCLEIAGISGDSVEHVAIGRNPRANVWRKVRYAMARRPSLALLRDRLQNAKRVDQLTDPLAAALGVGRTALPPLHHVEHHPAHLASAFFVSPFDDAAVCAIDGFGDFVSTSMGMGRGDAIDVLDRVYFPHSLGILYTAITQYLGFPSYGDEFKVMGLAPYGEPEFTREIHQLVRQLAGGKFELDLRYFRHWKEGVEVQWDDGSPTFGRVYSDNLVRLLGPARTPDEPLTGRHENIARSLQQVYEECAFHVLRGLWERTRIPRLCLAGGCAMNSVANGMIRDETPFTEVFIQPAAADSGTALGAAYHVWNQILGGSRGITMEHAYWGTEYPDPCETRLLQSLDVEVRKFHSRSYEDEADLCRAAARLLSEGMVVGWYQGRMEWGARALGNRSILADPTRPDMRELINTKIKFRERFRPFAPSVLEESLHEYFYEACPDPFMQSVFPVREDKRELLLAITHVDGTARVHSVSEQSNPRYHRLIREFAAISGVPVLLNTSFNENEPIVDTPEQAVDCFRRTRMDALVLGNTIVQRRGL